MPRFDPQLGVLISLLRERGHELSLLGVARFQQERVKSALAAGLPQLIYADIAAVCSDIAQRTLRYIQDHEFLPVVAGGQYATTEPAAALSLPGVQAVALGEPDASLITYFERMKDPAIGQVVRGVWLRDESGLARPQMPALVEDLDSLPFADRELFGYGRHVEETGEIEVAIGRGCPQACGYCLLPGTQALYGSDQSWARRRSAGNVLEELAALRAAYPGAKRVRFLDHAFGLDQKWLCAFLPRYRRAIELPFGFHARANAVNPEIIAALAEAGAAQADVEVISASDFIRNEMFGMELSAEQLTHAFAALHGANIETRAIFYFGAPYESEASLEDALALIRRLRPSRVDVRPYYPWPGSAATGVCRENGWLHRRGEEQFHQDRPGIDMPACRPELIMRFIRQAAAISPTGLGAPWWRRVSAAARSMLAQLRPKQR